jgi:hypothetical protein
MQRAWWIMQSVFGSSQKLRRWIIGAALVTAVIGGLGLWALIAGGGWIARQLPAWAETAGVATTGLREQAEATLPGVTRQLESWLPGSAPSADVGGEDIAGLARFPGLVRTSYELVDGRRHIQYRGPGDWRAAADFYAHELAAQGYRGTVTAASATGETRIYKSERRTIELRVAEAGQLGGKAIEVQLRERGG